MPSAHLSPPTPSAACPQSLLSAVKSSFALLRRRLASTAVGGVLFLERPLFSVDLQLRVPAVVLSPSLDDIQQAINDTAKKVAWAEGRDNGVEGRLAGAAFWTLLSLLDHRL